MMNKNYIKFLAFSIVILGGGKTLNNNICYGMEALPADYDGKLFDKYNLINNIANNNKYNQNNTNNSNNNDNLNNLQQSSNNNTDSQSNNTATLNITANSDEEDFVINTSSTNNNSLNNINSNSNVIMEQIDKHSTKNYKLDIKLLKAQSDNAFIDLINTIDHSNVLLLNTIQQLQNLCNNIIEVVITATNDDITKINFTQNDVLLYRSIVFPSRNNYLNRELQNNTDKILNYIQDFIIQIADNIKILLENPGQYDIDIWDKLYLRLFMDIRSLKRVMDNTLLEEKLLPRINPSNLSGTNNKALINLSKLIDKVIQDSDNFNKRLDTIHRSIYETLECSEQLYMAANNIVSQDWANIGTRDLETYSSRIIQLLLGFAECIKQGYKYNPKNKKIKMLNEEANALYKKAQKIKFKVSDIKECASSGSKIIKPILNDYKDENYITLEQLLIELAKDTYNITVHTYQQIYKVVSHQNNNTQQELEASIKKHVSRWLKKMQPIQLFLNHPWFKNQINKVDNKIFNELKANLSPAFIIWSELLNNFYTLKYN